jgi:hypothetical protein
MPDLFPTTRTRRPPRVKGRKLKAAERSMKYLRAQAYHVDKCEQYKSRFGEAVKDGGFAGGFRKDLFGFMDLLCYSDAEVLAVQTTSRQQITAHLRQYRRDPEVAAAIRDWIGVSGRRFVIHGWECVEMPTRKGGVKAVWQLTERVVTLADVTEEAF